MHPATEYATEMPQLHLQEAQGSIPIAGMVVQDSRLLLPLRDYVQEHLL